MHAVSRQFTLQRQLIAGLCAALGASMAVAAPTWAPFTRYEVALKIPEVSGTTKLLPVGVNESGQVFGSVVKQAGKVWKWVKPTCYADWLNLCSSAPPKLDYTQYINVYPAVWKNGVATTLPQFGGNYATWVEYNTAAGDYVVTTSTAAGRYPERVADSTIKRPPKVTRLLSPTGQYGEAFNTVDGEEQPFAVLRNQEGWLAVQRDVSLGGIEPLTLSFNGAQAAVAVPPGATRYRLNGLGKDGALLISVWAWDGTNAKGEAGRPTCFMSRQGALTPVNITVSETILQSRCGRLQDDGTVLGEVTVADNNPSLKSNTRTAIYAWKDGITELLTPYIADMEREVLDSSLPAINPVAYTKVGLLVRFDVGSWGLYRNGVTTNALKSAGVTLASGDGSELMGFNSAGQLLMKVTSGSKRVVNFYLLSPK